MYWLARVSQLFIFFFLYLTPTTVSSLLLMHGHKGPQSVCGHQCPTARAQAPFAGLARHLSLVPVSYLIQLLVDLIDSWYSIVSINFLYTPCTTTDYLCAVS
jgi:hypothetical protein